MASILVMGSSVLPIFAGAETEITPVETIAAEQFSEPTAEATTESTAATVEEESLPETTGETVTETTEETTAETTEETDPEQTTAETTIPEEPDFVDLDDIYEATAATLQSQTPGTGSIGGEWLVLALARAEKLTDQQKRSYLDTAKAYIEKKYNDAGKLHAYKPTENERLALALTAVGQDPANFYGYDLLKALEDTSWTTSQGNNASAFALLAYNAAGYAATNADALIQSLLSKQNTNGGWAITTGSSDTDTTAMVIQALAPYCGQAAVKNAVDTALAWLSDLVNEQGQICAGGHNPSAENVSQTIVALTELGIDPAEDSRFLRNGKTLLDGLITFYVAEEGGFAHEGKEAYNQMATEQAFYALVSVYRLRSGKTSLYAMGDVVRDWDAVARVEALIAAIGEVTADSGSAIRAARRAYDKLTAYQKPLVDNYDTLTAAETAYAVYDRTEEDEQAAKAVEALIEAIGTPVTLDSGEAIALARKAYDALTATQKTLVSNSSTLNAAENALEELQDQEAALAVDDLIGKIGTVTLSREAAVQKARKAYNALSKAQKQLVTDYQTLVDAESALQELKATVSVKFALLGCWEHGTSGEVHTLADGNLSTWIKQKTYRVSPGATVREVMEKALTAADMTWENPTGNYVESIEGIGEFTNGSLSGWMYTLNGKHPNQGVNEQTIQNGDVIVFHYTDDYTREEGSEQYQKGTSTPVLSATPQTASAENATAQDAYQQTGDYLESLGTPGVGSIGGEWMVLGLSRSDRQVPEGYYEQVLTYVQQEIDENGRLHRAKSTDNSRLILALTAIGRDVTDIGGHDLLQGLTDLEYVCKQGINGPIWALIAFDSGNYPIPEGTVSRETLIRTILAAQLPDGGWALSGEASDPDMTGMALQALAPYCEKDPQVGAAAEKAVRMLAEIQNADGGYSGIDGPSSESIAQVIVALTALGIDPASDDRFVKNGRSVLDALLDYYVEGGGFRHIPDGGLDGMATEQGYYALTAYQRFRKAETLLYDMTDAVDQGGDPVMAEAPEAKEKVPQPVLSEASAGERDLGLLLLGICAGICIGLVLGILLCTAGIIMWLCLKKQAANAST